MATKTTKLNVSLHDGTSFIMEVDNFNSADLRKQMEEKSRDHVLLGDFPIYKSAIRFIVPAPEQSNS